MVIQWYGRELLPLPKCIRLHIISLNGSCQVLDHSIRLSISLCNDCVSASDKTGLYNFASSANSLQQFFTTLGMSFIKNNEKDWA